MLFTAELIIIRIINITAILVEYNRVESRTEIGEWMAHLIYHFLLFKVIVDVVA